MLIDRDNLRDLLTAVAMIGAAMLVYSLLLPARAHAQIAVEDAVTEGNTATIAAGVHNANVQLGKANGHLSDDVQENTLSANSLTSGGGAGAYQGQAQYLDSLTQIMASGVADTQTFAATYPGWSDSGPEGAALARKITAKTLTTFADALGVVQSQAADAKAEDAKFQQIESCSAGAGAVLALLQCDIEAQLANAQQIQMERQLLETLITVEAIKGGVELDIPAQQGANQQAAYMGAAQGGQ